MLHNPAQSVNRASTMEQTPMTHLFRFQRQTLVVTASLSLLASAATAQPGPPGGRGGGNQERAVVAQFDADKNGRLNIAERRAAQEFLAQPGNAGRGGFGRGGGNRPPSGRGIPLTPADVASFPD